MSKPRLLVSVRNADEAADALAGGAQVIDAKDVSNGALGMLPASTIREILNTVGGLALVSATAGEVDGDIDRAIARCDAVAGTGVDFAKFGLTESVHSRMLLERIAPLADCVGLIAVLLVDRCRDLSLIDAAAQAGCAGVMVDTADKHGAGLCASVSDLWLRDFVQRARSRGLLVGMAGKLALADVAPLTLIGPDLMGFRSALCATDRSGALDAGRVATLFSAIAQAEPAP